MFQGGAYGLYVPQHQEQQEQTAHQAGGAIKILYGLHNALCGVYRREELIRIIEYSGEKLTLAELEALYYDMTTKSYIND